MLSAHDSGQNYTYRKLTTIPKSPQLIKFLSRPRLVNIKSNSRRDLSFLWAKSQQSNWQKLKQVWSSEHISSSAILYIS